MMANDRGLDFERIRQAAQTTREPRTCRPRLRRRPCLFKDTMQLAAFNNNTSRSAHRDDDQRGMPLYLVHRLEQRFNLASMTSGSSHGVQGRFGRHPVSLSYKLKRILAFKAKAVHCTDPT